MFGVGAGWNEEEMADHGTDPKTRFRLMREKIEAMKAIWTENKSKYDGEFVKFGEMMTWPKPVQKPHPPVIVGGAFPYGARRAIRFGDGWIPLGGGRGVDIPTQIPHFRQMAAEAGRNPDDIEISVFAARPVEEELKKQCERMYATAFNMQKSRHNAFGVEQKDYWENAIYYRSSDGFVCDDGVVILPGDHNANPNSGESGFCKGLDEEDSGIVVHEE